MQYPLQEKIGDPELLVGRERREAVAVIEFQNFGKWLKYVWTAEQGLAHARQMPEPKQRAQAASLAPHLPDQLLHKALEVARAIGYDKERAQALASLAPQLTALPFAMLYPLWCETLPILAGRTRKQLLADLGTLVPVIVALGGEEAVKEVVQAVQDVGRWWP